ncbi:DUF3388 domain-containing protein, partial [Virgibacillus halodenitrificans]|nr:DUF3388 domain-containing protein [Virgibacillus halodenitrificans]
EHPDIFVQSTEYNIDDFDYIIELRSHEDEKITYEPLEDQQFNQESGFSMFDF